MGAVNATIPPCMVHMKGIRSLVTLHDPKIVEPSPLTIGSRHQSLTDGVPRSTIVVPCHRTVVDVLDVVHEPTIVEPSAVTLVARQLSVPGNIGSSVTLVPCHLTARVTV